MPGDVDPAQYLAECVEIEPDLLDEEFIRLPADMAYWGAQFAEAARSRDFATLLVKQEKARAEHRVRAANAPAVTENVPPVADIPAESDKKKAKATERALSPKLTEAAVAAAVALDPEVMKAEQAAIDADFQVNRVKGVLDAVRCKKDMVVQMGAVRRTEMEGDPLIRQRHAQRRDAQGNL